jgi:hypothetical protein
MTTVSFWFRSAHGKEMCPERLRSDVCASKDLRL